MTEHRSEAKAEKLSYAATDRQRNVTRFKEKMAFCSQTIAPFDETRSHVLEKSVY